MFWCRSLFWFRGVGPFLSSFGAGTPDCLAVGTCLRAFFQVGRLPVAEGSFPLVPGPQIAWLLYLPARLLSGRASAGGYGLLRFAAGISLFRRW